MKQRRSGSTTEDWTPQRRRQQSKSLKRAWSKKSGVRGPLQREALKITDEEYADACGIIALVEFERRMSSYGNMSRARFAEVAELIEPDMRDAVRARLKNGEAPFDDD